MPGYNDLDLPDLDLKTDMMDASLLLDTFSADEIDIWNNYNLFTDEHLNSLKDSIKEENIDIEADCLSSICPNDLINSQEHQQNNHNHNHHHHNQIEELYNNNNDDDLNYKFKNETNNFLNNEANDYLTSSVNEIEINNLIDIDTYCNSRSSSTSSRSSSVTSDNNDYIDDLILTSNSKQQQQQNKQIQQNQTSNNNNNNMDFIINNIQNMHNYPLTQKNLTNSIQINNYNNQQQNAQQSTKIINNTDSYQVISKNRNTSNNSNNNLNNKLQKAVMPPSPPSSFGSDSESNHSSSSPLHNSLNGNSNNPLRSTTTIIKKIRHQPYTMKSNTNDTKNFQLINNKSNVVSNTTTSNTNVCPVSQSYSSSASSSPLQQNNLDDDCWPFLCSLSKLPSSGPLLLTEEEKRTLKQENLAIPTQLPLSKGEEKILKKIRRKIKNKISAQESRRKKKEYVDSLEKRVENYINENIELKKRLEDLEINNKTLITQLQKMQNTLNQSNTNQFGTILMVVVLFFAVVLGVWSPLLTKDQMTSATTSAAANTASNSAAKNSNTDSGLKSVVDNEEIRPFHSFNTPTLKSRVLLSIDDELMPFDVSGGGGGGGDVDSGDGGGNCYDLGPHVPLSNGNSQYSSSTAFISTTANNNSTQSGRSKSGNAVELTKVRPFVRKIPISGTVSSGLSNKNDNTCSTNGGGNNNNEYIILNNSNEDTQIIILNLPSNNNSDSQNSDVLFDTTKLTKQNTLVPTVQMTKLNNLGLSVSKNQLTTTTTTNSNKRIINSAKVLPSKYRLINGANSSIIKLNSTA